MSLQYTFNGRTYNTDDYNTLSNPTGLGAGGARLLWSQLWTDIMTDVGVGFQMSAADSLAIGTGAKVFTPATMRGVPIGSWVQVVNAASVWMWGQVTDKTATQITVDVSRTEGVGTYGAWTIQITGPGGSVGPAGTKADIADVPTNPLIMAANLGTFGV
jgi:hypothetical protein